MSKEEEANLLDDEIRHSVGLEKQLLQWRKEGNLQPFGPEKVSGHFGTPQNPAIIPSLFEMRIVGCTGPKDHEHDVLWHHVWEGKPTVCLACGQFFVHKWLEAPVFDPAPGYVTPREAYERSKKGGDHHH